LHGIIKGIFEIYGAKIASPYISNESKKTLVKISSPHFCKIFQPLKKAQNHLPAPFKPPNPLNLAQILPF